jgi:hypothetical protein
MGFSCRSKHWGVHEPCMNEGSCIPEDFRKAFAGETQGGRPVRKRRCRTSQWLLCDDGAPAVSRRMKLVLPSRLLAVIVYGASVLASLDVPVIWPPVKIRQPTSRVKFPPCFQLYPIWHDLALPGRSGSGVNHLIRRARVRLRLLIRWSLVRVQPGEPIQSAS